MHELEEGDPPEKLEDWPDGKAKYLTYGGPEGTEGYDEGPTRKLGPSSLEHHEDGSVSIEGEKVDDPEKYKGERLPDAPEQRLAPDPPALGHDAGVARRVDGAHPDHHAHVAAPRERAPHPPRDLAGSSSRARSPAGWRPGCGGGPSAAGRAACGC